MSTGRMPWRTRALGAAIVTIVLAACGGSTTTPTASTAVAPSASASTSPSVSAGDVKAAFLDALADPKFSATATVSGTIALAGITGEVNGEWSFIGRDAHRTTTISLPGNDQTNETITLGPDGWERTGDGPWLAQEKAADPKKSFTGTLAILRALEDRGVESREGVDLYHFEPATGGAIPAVALGLDNPEIKAPKVTADFYATGAGVPAAFDFHITWTQAIGGQDAPVSMDMQIDIDEVGSPQSIDPPARNEVWTRYKSNFGYTMAHPPAWTVEHSKTEDTYLLDGQPYVHVAPQVLPSGTKLNSFLGGLIASYKQQFGTEPDSRESTSIRGVPAFRLVYHFRNDADQDVALVDVATVQGGRGWEIFILTLSGGTETEDIDVFDDFMSTFRFTK